MSRNNTPLTDMAFIHERMRRGMAIGSGRVGALLTRIEAAEADAAALRNAIIDYLECPTCHGAGVHWTDINGEAQPESCDMRDALDVVIAAQHPGAALLAELEAARAVVDQARRGFGTEADIERAWAFDPVALCAAIRRYDAAARKE